MTSPAAAELRIEPERSPARFLDLQRAFYAGDPHFVPPLTWEERWELDSRRNPFFSHAEVGLFTARRDGRPVGRISTTRDRMHDELHGDRVGFFGHFEAADAGTAQALLQHAERWLVQRGATELRGPVGLSTNYRCGLLIEGEAGLPVVGMPHNPRHYAGWIESAGFRKAKDLLALRVHERDLQMERLDRLVARIVQRSGVVLRPLDLRRFGAECELLWQVYERAWERNWGFAPMPRAEFLAQAKHFRPLCRAELTHIAEVEGRPVGFAIGLPDANVAIHACGGRLLPFGWLRFLRALRRTRRIRVITLGLLPEVRGSGIDAVLLHALVRRGLVAGFNECDASWILEDNRLMLSPLELLGGKVSRRFRIYGKRPG